MAAIAALALGRRPPTPQLGRKAGCVTLEAVESRVAAFGNAALPAFFVETVQSAEQSISGGYGRHLPFRDTGGLTTPARR